MSFIQGPLAGKTLPDIADEIHNAELAIALEGLTTNGGKNYAEHTDPADTPETGIDIRSKASVPPKGASKICDGKLTISGVAIDVTAYRLP
jgi:hypothetical protein